MPTKRRIVVAGLEGPIQSTVNECLPSDHFEITEFDESKVGASTARADLVIFHAPKDLEQTMAVCVTLRAHVGEGTPLLACAGRNVFPLIRKLVGNVVQSMIMMPSNACELRQKLDKLDLGF